MGNKIRIALLFVFTLCMTINVNAQISYKQQIKLEKKANKVHKRLGIDKDRVLELMKMDKHVRELRF